MINKAILFELVIKTALIYLIHLIDIFLMNFIFIFNLRHLVEKI
jgi:hypothetical protein